LILSGIFASYLFLLLIDPDKIRYKIMDIIGLLSSPLFSLSLATWSGLDQCVMWLIKMKKC